MENKMMHKADFYSTVCLKEDIISVETCNNTDKGAHTHIHTYASSKQHEGQKKGEI